MSMYIKLYTLNINNIYLKTEHFKTARFEDDKKKEYIDVYRFRLQKYYIIVDWLLKGFTNLLPVWQTYRQTSHKRVISNL